MHVLLTVLFVLSSTSGLVFNGFILLVLLWQKRFHTANHLLLLHLATVDTLFCLLVLLVNTSITFVHPQSLDLQTQGFLRLHGVLWTVLPAVLMWTICGMSMDRYASVCYPFTHGKLVNRKRAGLLILGSWLVSLSLSVPPLVGLCAYRFSEPRFAYAIACTERKFFSAELTFSLILISFLFLLPLLVIVATQLHILVIARSQRGKIVSALNHSVGHKSDPTFANPWTGSKGRTGFTLVSILLSSFACLWLPTLVLSLAETIRGRDVHPLLVSAATVLFTLIPSVNAYVYGVKSRLLRQTFKRLLQRYLYQQQASLEIERRISLRSQSSTRFSLAWHSLTHPAALPVNLMSQRTLRRYSAPVISVTEPEASPDRSAVRRFSTHTLLLRDSRLTCPRHLDSMGKTRSPGSVTLTFKEHDARSVKTNLSPIQEVAQTLSSEAASGKSFV